MMASPSEQHGAAVEQTGEARFTRSIAAAALIGGTGKADQDVPSQIAILETGTPPATVMRPLT